MDLTRVKHELRERESSLGNYVFDVVDELFDRFFIATVTHFVFPYIPGLYSDCQARLLFAKGIYAPEDMRIVFCNHEGNFLLYDSISNIRPKQDELDLTYGKYQIQNSIMPFLEANFATRTLANKLIDEEKSKLIKVRQQSIHHTKMTFVTGCFPDKTVLPPEVVAHYKDIYDNFVCSFRINVGFSENYFFRVHFRHEKRDDERVEILHNKKLINTITPRYVKKGEKQEHTSLLWVLEKPCQKFDRVDFPYTDKHHIYTCPDIDCDYEEDDRIPYWLRPKNPWDEE